MRLKRIKLSGFKSFVDPTVVEFPSPLVGVCGPNGSGKSNVIDAVRWVMGESSAKHLRGEQMADVIFNGSSGRKPLGNASVEMVFDNSSGELGGEYARFSEIAIRRQIDREGVSGYFLNGSRCRRRDITDVFLGTGLGPRSYSIIEQGTISRLVESKPDELREFLEEAAGISRYKERRRETENRIRHTKENLERVDDLLEEVSKRLTHLKRQARAAERYQELRARERLLKAQSLALRLKGLEEDYVAEQKNARTRELEIESVVARERTIERELVSAREEYASADDAAREVQSHYYELGAEIARLEQVIKGVEAERRLLEQRLSQIDYALVEARRQWEHEKISAVRIRSELDELNPAIERAKAEQDQREGRVSEYERAYQKVQQEWEVLLEALSDMRRECEVSTTRNEEARRRQAGLRARRDRLGKERQEIDLPFLKERSRKLAEQLERERQSEVAFGIRVTQRQRAVEEHNQKLSQLDTHLAELRDQRARLEGRLASLRALQEKALGDSASAVAGWLSEHGLEKAERLASSLVIDPGWEWAVEVVLADRLAALAIAGSAGDWEEALQSLNAGTITLVDSNAKGEAPAGTLAARVQGPDAVKDWLGSVYTAEETANVYQLRSSLTDGKSVITREGYWLGRNWSRMARPGHDEAGVMARRQEIKELAEQLEVQVAEINEILTDRESLIKAREEAMTWLREARQHARDRAESMATLSADEARALEQYERAAERQQNIAQELEEIETAEKELSESLDSTVTTMSNANTELERLSRQRDALSEARNQAASNLASARESLDEARHHREALSIRAEGLRTQLQSADTACEGLKERIEQLQTEKAEASESVTATHLPEETSRRKLTDLVTDRKRIEEQLTERREQVSSIEMRIRDLDQDRQKVDTERESLRDALQELKVHEEQIRTRREGLYEQLAALQAEPQSVLASLGDDPDVNDIHAELEQVDQKIQRLGAINLAAIDECAQEAERESYLDRQRSDLIQAMETLESAIRRIDQETRSRFRDTFEKVNGRLAELFPVLFGGGEAALVLTGNELLDAGVVVTARPPGKRNATIQMLSGGEKALVAVALVFAIFELNPAPFCLLDEVDAPMDDANVERFCQLVESMSKRVQFIVITHNRRTMARAHQLIGVTMQEPGVSRLVGVDLDEAERLAVG